MLAKASAGPSLRLKPQMRSTYKLEGLIELKESKTPVVIEDQEGRKSAVKVYQDGMDSRLSMPRRVQSRFIGVNERSTGNLSVNSN